MELDYYLLRCFNGIFWGWLSMKRIKRHISMEQR